jgi:SulP family sulfate permease
VLLSLVLYLERTSKPRIVTLTPDPRLPKRALTTELGVTQCPQLRIIRIDGSLFFGSINHVEQTFDRFRAEHPEQRHLALVASGINFVDLQGGDALAQEAARRKADGGDFYLINVKQGLWEALERCGCMEAAGARNIFQSKEAAIHAIYQKLDRSICEHCEKRIFLECRR